MQFQKYGDLTNWHVKLGSNTMCSKASLVPGLLGGDLVDVLGQLLHQAQVSSGKNF